MTLKESANQQLCRNDTYIKGCSHGAKVGTQKKMVRPFSRKYRSTGSKKLSTAKNVTRTARAMHERFGLEIYPYLYLWAISRSMDGVWPSAYTIKWLMFLGRLIFKMRSKHRKYA